MDHDSNTSTSTDAPPTKPRGLTVYLEDHDFRDPDEEDGSGADTPHEAGLYEGERMRGGINLVKATVSSMMHPVSSGAASPGSLGIDGNRIARVPTPRPPNATD